MHSSRSLLRRGVVAAILALALVAAASIDLGASQSGPSAVFAPAFSISPPASDSSTWYCSMPRLDKEQGVKLKLELTNTSTRLQTARVDFYTGKTKDHVRKFVVVEGGSNKEMSVVLPSSSAGGAVVSFPGGGDVVGMVATGKQGYSQLLCQPSPGPHWLVEGLSTQGNSTAALSVFNPFSTDAIVDFTLLTPSGVQEPGPLQAVVVGPHASKEVYLPDWVQSTGPIAAQVTTRLGRIVAGAVEIRSDPAANGVALAPVSAQVYGSYHFPLLAETTNQGVTLQLYNLSSRAQKASVLIRALAIGGEVPTTTTLAPSTTLQAGSPKFHESVPAQGTLEIPLKTIASVPIGAPFSMQVTGDVVAMVVVTGSTGGPTTGLAEEPGVNELWHKWFQILYGMPPGAEPGQVAVVATSNNGGNALVEPFYFHQLSNAAKLSGVDNPAGVSMPVDSGKLQLYPSKLPGGMPAAFTISTSSQSLASVALMGKDGSLTPLSLIPLS